MRTAAGLAGEFGGGCAWRKYRGTRREFAGGWARALRGLQKLPRSPAGSAGDPATVIGCRRTRGGWWAVVREAGTVCDRSARTGAGFPRERLEHGAAIRFTAGLGIGHRTCGCKHVAVSKALAKYDPAAGFGVLTGISVRSARTA